MASPHYDSPISVIEDLDPDPPVNGSRLRRRELILGLLLVLGVLAWSGAQWWNQQEMQSEYLAGQLAASAHDWDNALTHYTSAGGYRDSHDRASEATRLIKQRDDSYELLNDAMQKADWLSAVKLVGSVRSIQPRYRDIDRLEDRARQSIYSEELAGAVVLRMGANPAGLYFRSPGGWQWLEKSDRFSSVRGLGITGTVLYDVPTAGWKPDFSTPPDQSQPFYYVPESGSPDLRGRSLMLLIPDGTGPHFIPLVLDPSIYNSYVVGDRGVWSLRYRGPNTTSSDPKVQALLRKSQAGISASFDIAYQAFGTVITYTVGIDSGGQLLGYSPDGEHILLSEQFDMPGTGPVSRLFVAAATGTDRRLIYTTGGRLQTAAFSPNDQYVLTTTAEELPDQTEEQSAVVLATDGSLPPRTVLQSRSTSPAAKSRPLLDARFLTAGAFAGRVLVVGWSDGTSSVNIYDPAGAGDASLSVQVPGRSASRLYVGEVSDEHTLLLAWHNGSGGVWPDADSITLARIRPGMPVATSRLPINLGESLWDVQARDGYLVYTTAARKVSADTEAAFLVRSLPLSQIGTETPRPVLLYQDGADLTEALGVQSWNLGNHLLAFSNAGQLSVRSYSGAGSIVLDEDTVLITVPPPRTSK